MQNEITILGARQNNLKSVNIKIPHNKFTVVTGVSGSGKSSLIFEIINSESKRRFFEFFSSNAIKLSSKMQRADIQHISGLSPVISVSQKSSHKNSRSTVGTLSEISDYLRLLFARFGKSDDSELKINRNLFSFNSQTGACPTCKGLGTEEKINPDLLIADANKTLRDRALKITQPSGYTIYSQVTIDVLNDVCKSEGFNVDTAWNELSDYQKNIVLNGSQKIKIPFGKHTLESRMKWSGIKAKPREEGFYKGILPIMQDILKRDRNPNILKFASSEICSSCKGTRLNGNALSVKFEGKTIADFLKMTIFEIFSYFSEKGNEKYASISKEIVKRSQILNNLGLDYLTLNRSSETLSGGEMQRIRLSTQIGSKLRGITYIFDEPSIGLHAKDNKQLIDTLRLLQKNGNTVIVIEHDKETILSADHVIDIGAFAGENGGEIIFESSIYEAEKNKINSLTLDYIFGRRKIEVPKKKAIENPNFIRIFGAKQHNLKNIDISFQLSAFNVVTGVSGAGKSTLVKNILSNYFKSKLQKKNITFGKFDKIEGLEFIDKIIEINQQPIGKTPRSNPATYTKLFEQIRNLFAQLPETKQKKWTKSQFSFNTKGGRCEICEGTGIIQTGMHFLGNVNIVCEKCNGKRFNNETLSLKYKGKNIHDILKMKISEAELFFSDKPKILKYIKVLNDLGLGYLELGQSSDTLSGGEAQRIKLATELIKPDTGKTLYILDEPTTGLHFYDIQILLNSLHKLTEKGNTIIAIEHNTDLIKTADRIIDLGAESGEKGGNLVFEGSIFEILKCKNSHTAKALIEDLKAVQVIDKKDVVDLQNLEEPIKLRGISTNNLKNIDVDIPVNKITVITGVSGSGKSSLAFDTLFAEAYNRYTENFSNYIRNMGLQQQKSDFEEITGLMPAIAIGRKKISQNPRSTVGTLSEVYDYYRLLYSRASENNVENLLSTAFSFNSEQGACPACKGLGNILSCDIEKLVTNPELSILSGAMKGTRTGKTYGDIYGKEIAILKTVATENNFDIKKSWQELSPEIQNVIMFGTGEKEYDVVWKYKRKNNSGEHKFKSVWQGFANIINEEYAKKHAGKYVDSFKQVMSEVECSECKSNRLNNNVLKVKFNGLNIAELSSLSIAESLDFFKNISEKNIGKNNFEISKDIRKEIIRKLSILQKSGLEYLQINRSVASLSGGETQRLKLASIAGSELTGVCYVLDEPTVGLHSKDTKKLIEVIENLKDNGNTIVIVEHDAEIMKIADFIVDIGEKSGKNGGKIIAKGTFEEIIKNPKSKTGKYLKNLDSLYQKLEKNLPKASLIKNGISIKGAFKNNLKNIDIEIPKGVITAVTGVSGSGKTSLIMDVLAESYKKSKPIFCKEISGFGNFENLILVNQNDIGNSSVSNILTYTKIFDDIRNVFAKIPDKNAVLHKKNFFSFNTKGGRCENCKGSGIITTKMDFLADIQSVCEICEGKRYNEDALSVLYKNKSISDILNMTVGELYDFFQDNNKISSKLKVLNDTGLSYIQAGQSTKTFSGGELQRLKLANELIGKKSTNSLYIFDEPSKGLHFEDIENLQKIFDSLINQGNTIIVIEHNEQIISKSDYIIELGKSGGNKGGEIVFMGF